MKPIVGLFIAVALCAGCKSAQPVYDPFLGPTTVPPPGTAVPPPGQPYYGAPPTAAPTMAAPPPGASTGLRIKGSAPKSSAVGTDEGGVANATYADRDSPIRHARMPIRSNFLANIAIFPPFTRYRNVYGSNDRRRC